MRSYKRQLTIAGKPMQIDPGVWLFSVRYGMLLINGFRYTAGNRHIRYPRRAVKTQQGFTMRAVVAPVFHTQATGKIRALIEQWIAQNNVTSQPACDNLMAAEVKQ